MDVNHGLDVLKKLAQGTEWYEDFLVQEAKLLLNLRDERRFGYSPQTQQDRNRILDELNALSLKYLKISFNDLCQDKFAHSQAVSYLSNTPQTDQDSSGRPGGHTVYKQEHKVSHFASLINVFISCEEQDRKYLEELHTHLAPFLRSGLVNSWDVTKVPIGSNPDEERRKALQTAQIAIVLVSANFWRSDIILAKELTPLLASARHGKITLIPVILGAGDLKGIEQYDELVQYQPVNAPSQPLSDMGPGERSKIWSRVVGRIREILK